MAVIASLLTYLGLNASKFIQGTKDVKNAHRSMAAEITKPGRGMYGALTEQVRSMRAITTMLRGGGAMAGIIYGVRQVTSGLEKINEIQAQFNRGLITARERQLELNDAIHGAIPLWREGFALGESLAKAGFRLRDLLPGVQEDPFAGIAEYEKQIEKQRQYFRGTQSLRDLTASLADKNWETSRAIALSAAEGDKRLAIEQEHEKAVRRIAKEQERIEAIYLETPTLRGWLPAEKELAEARRLADLVKETALRLLDAADAAREFEESSNWKAAIAAGQAWENAIRDVDNEIERLQNQIDTFDMTPLEVKLFAGRKAGVPGTLLADLEKYGRELDRLTANQKITERGRRIFEETRKPIEKFAETLAELDELLAESAIDWETYQRAVEGAMGGLEDAGAAPGRPALAQEVDIAGGRFVSSDLARRFEDQKTIAKQQLAEMRKTNVNLDRLLQGGGLRN